MHHDSQGFSCSLDWPGSTTKGAGSTECIRPTGGEDWQCTSGTACRVSIQGHSLESGHRLALTSSNDCGNGAVEVSRAGASAESSEGTTYIWNDFAPPGGNYKAGLPRSDPRLSKVNS